MKKIKTIVMCLVFGALIGFINGFFGGGGGMIAVPLLMGLFKLTEKQSHATSIAVILPLTIVSSIVYILKNPLNYINMSLCGIGVLMGGITGAFILKKINNKILSIIFSLIMLFAGVKLLF